MWVKDKSVLSNNGFVEESVVNEGYIVAQGVEASYTFLDGKNNLTGRDIFGDVFHIFKVNPENPLKVRMYRHGGSLSVKPTSERYEGMFPAEIMNDANCWNAAAFFLVPGDEKSLDYAHHGLKKVVFEDSFRTNDGRTFPVSLVSILSSHGVDFGGNYQSLMYGFVPPAQVGAHLYNWMIRERKVISHEKTWEQRPEGHIYLGRDTKVVREKFWQEIVPELERKFEEQVTFQREQH